MKSRSRVINLICLFLVGVILSIGNVKGVNATTPCGEQVGVTSDDSDCGYLDDELIAFDLLSNYPGIYLDVLEESDKKLQVGFDTNLIRSRTWGGGSNFTWTFDGSGTNSQLDFNSNGRVNMTGYFNHLAVGANSSNPQSNVSLYVKETYETDAGNRGALIEYTQDSTVTYPVYPVGLACAMDYSPPQETPTELYYDGDALDVIFTQNSNLVETEGDFLNLDNWTLEEYQLIKKGDTGEWYTIASGVGSITSTTIKLVTPFKEASGTDSAFAIKAAYRMAAITASNNLKKHGSTAGATDALRGIVGAATMEDGIVSNAIGIRGGIHVSGGDMGLGVCVGTESVKVTGGNVDYIVGMGVEHMSLSGGTVGEVVGIGMQRLVAPNCGATVGDIYGFKQDGNERNLFHGYMEVDTDITANTTDQACYSATVDIDDVSASGIAGFKYEIPGY